MVVVGFVVFYLIPYAFTFRNYALFLGILNAILLGMLFGLAILASLVQPYLEQLLVRFMCVFTHAKLRPLVNKNLAGHRSRNSKTAHMFTVCLAFIVFAGVMFSLQTRSISDNVKVLFGADIMVQAPGLNDALAEANLRGFLNGQLSSAGGVVRDFTFVTFDLRRTDPVQSLFSSNLASFPQWPQQVIGVERNYLQVFTGAAPPPPRYRHRSILTVCQSPSAVAGVLSIACWVLNPIILLVFLPVS
jgi:hypothetical protein